MYWRSPLSFLIVPLWRGQLNIKLDSKSLPSERFGSAQSIALCGIRFTWRSWR